MNNTICYINTDLDLISTENISELAAFLESQGIPPMGEQREDDGRLCYARFETSHSYQEPEPNIEAMISIIESLSEPLRSIWFGCKSREFDIGYNCGDAPWAFNQGISSALLDRIAALGASLRWTIYPNRDSKVAADPSS